VYKYSVVFSWFT